MDQFNRGEEATAPLLIKIDQSRTCKAVEPRKNHARDAHILSFAFFFIFCAYSAAQNLESTVNTKGDLGTTSLAVLYTSFTVFSLVASSIVRGLGSKNALLLGSTGYFVFLLSHFKPSWYTMVPASLYLGFTSSIIWVSQGTYITSAARSHARDNNLNEGTVIGSFNGELCGLFASTQVIGNLITLFLLGDAKGGSTNLLYAVFVVCMIVGAILLCFLTKREEKTVEIIANEKSSFGNTLSSIVAPLLESRLRWILPLLLYYGLQHAFVWAEFTKQVVVPALGVSGVGGAMAVYGATDAISSVAVGRLTSGLHSITWTVSVGAGLQTLVMLWLLLGYSLSSGVLGSVYPLVMAALWGMGDGVLMTQLNALIGLLCECNTEAAFGQLKMCQGGAIAAILFLSPLVTFQAMLVVMIASLCVAMSGFLHFTLSYKRPSLSES